MALWLFLSLIGPPAAASSFPVAAAVSDNKAEIFDEPDERSYLRGFLERGERVTVAAAGPDGWLAIDPPEGSVYWIEQSTLSDAAAASRVRCAKVKTTIRSGNPDARMPGPPCATLEKGTTLELLPKPALTLTTSDGAKRGSKTWCPIAPPLGLVVYVRAEGVQWLERSGERETEDLTSRRLVPVVEKEATRTSFEEGSASAPGSLPPEIAAEVVAIESAQRSVLREPVERWRLEPIRRRYEALLERVSDAVATAAVRARLDRLARQEAMAEAARNMESILQKSRRRDRELLLYRRRLLDAERPSTRPFLAQGLVQPSSHRFQGQKVLALIGPRGETLAYLDMPPGLDSQPFVARKVGIRGSVHYNEDLHARLVTVRDIELLDVDR